MNVSILAQVNLFTGLSLQELDELARCLRRRRYARGQVVFVQGDPGTSLYIVEQGRVKIVRASSEGRELVLTVMGPGDFFGELALLDGEQRSADAIAQEDCQLLLLPRDDFARFVRARAESALSLLAVLSRRLRSADQLAQDAVFLDVPTRLARVLLHSAEGQVESTEHGPRAACHVTQAELAGRIGTTRETINKWLGTYQRQGLIRCRRGQITILEPAELRKRTY